MIIGGYNYVAGRISAVYSANNRLLADVLTRIASGKKIQRPSDDFVGYIRAQAYQTDIDAYNVVKQNLTEAKGVAEMAAELGGGIYEDLVRMRELAALYADATDDEDKAAYNAEFEALASSIQDTIDNNNYGATAVVSATTIISVGIDPAAPANTLDVAFVAGDIVSDLSDGTWDLDGGGGAAKDADDVTAEIDKATSYLVKAEAFVDKIDRQITITDTVIQSKEAAKSLITDIDEAEEAAKSVDLSIRQDAAVAMIAQANLLRSHVARLFDGTY